MIDDIFDEALDKATDHLLSKKHKSFWPFWMKYLLVTIIAIFGTTLLSSFLYSRVSPAVDNIILNIIIALWILIGLWWFIQAIVLKKYLDATGVLFVGLLTAATVFILGSLG